MKAAPARRALVATHHLVGYAGSEVFTLELSTELRDMGWEVLVATLLLGEPMASEFEKQGFQIVDLLSEASAIGNAKFDLAWIHHAPVFYELFMAQGIEASMVVFCSLSHFYPLEAVPEYREKFDLLLANSIENGNHITRSLGLNEGQVVVFPNAVPRNYWGRGKESHNTVLKRIAIISNHPPPEELEAAALLKKNGIEVTHIGTGGTQILMNPDLLLNFDLVITIGKTIPYCFALKVPVYCYDHFGGPGWLNEYNLNLASQNNFSGRGFSKKSPETIADEIVKGYQESLSRLNAHLSSAEKSLKLRENLESLFSRPKVSFPKQLNAISTKQILMQHTQYVRLVKVLSDREAELGGLYKEILRVKSTFSWRLTSPLRAAYNIVRRIIGLH